MEYSVEGESISNIADAIRERSGSEDPMTLSQMPGLIRNLPGGGGEGHKVTISLNSSTHQYSADADYATISEWLTNNEYVYAVYNDGIYIPNYYSDNAIYFTRTNQSVGSNSSLDFQIFEIRVQGGPLGLNTRAIPRIYDPASSNVGKYLKSVETGTGTYAYEPSDLPEKEQVISYADYMALTDTQKNNGKSYYIYDAQNEGREIQPVIYSEDEREIGVWTDGKPLYQKTFLPGYVTPTHSGSQSINFAIDIHTLNVDTVVYLDGIWQRWAGDDAKLLYRFTHSESNYADAYLRVDSENNYPNGRINVSIKSEGTDFQLITIRYTKTTDIPGSGHFVPSGVPAVHYDGNEKIVGTWFGETLYEKTIRYDGEISTGARTVPHGISNLGTVVNIFGIINHSTITPYGETFPSKDSSMGRVSVKTTNIEINTTGSWEGYIFYITLQYTKTS